MMSISRLYLIAQYCAAVRRLTSLSEVGLDAGEDIVEDVVYVRVVLVEEQLRLVHLKGV